MSLKTDVEKKDVIDALGLKLTNGLVAHYSGETWDPTTNKWMDATSNHNDSNPAQGTINSVSVNNLPAISGNTGSSIIFPPGILPPSYTLFHIAKYTTGGRRGRIFVGTSQDWLSGFYNGRSGVAHHNGWVTEYADRHGYDLVMSTDTRMGYRSNGIDRKTGNGGNVSVQLAINIHGERSDWTVAEVIVYDRELTLDEMLGVEQYLYKKYYDIGTLPVKDGLLVQYSGDHIRKDTIIDESDNNLNATTAGNITTFKHIDHTAIAGDTDTYVLFPSVVLPPKYTMFHIAKYNGGTKNRIFNGRSDNNFLSGFWGGRSGVAHHGKWISSENDKHGSEWVQSTDLLNRYRSNGVERTIGGVNAGYTPPILTINAGDYNEKSDWALLSFITYERELSQVEIEKMEMYLKYNYLVVPLGTPKTITITTPAPTKPITVAKESSGNLFSNILSTAIKNTPLSLVHKVTRKPKPPVNVSDIFNILIDTNAVATDNIDLISDSLRSFINNNGLLVPYNDDDDTVPSPSVFPKLSDSQYSELSKQLRRNMVKRIDDIQNSIHEATYKSLKLIVPDIVRLQKRYLLKVPANTTGITGDMDKMLSLIKLNGYSNLSVDVSNLLISVDIKKTTPQNLSRFTRVMAIASSIYENLYIKNTRARLSVFDRMTPEQKQAETNRLTSVIQNKINAARLKEESDANIIIKAAVDRANREIEERNRIIAAKEARVKQLKQGLKNWNLDLDLSF